MFNIGMALRLYIEDPKHHFITRMSDHPTRLRIYSTRDMAAEFEQLNADAI
jgi:hypothetical protein